MSKPQVVKRRYRRGKTSDIDSKKWNLPVNPPETTFSVMPFTLQGGLELFDCTKDNNYRITYQGVNSALRTAFSYKTDSKWSIRVTNVGVYGQTSQPQSGTVNSTQDVVKLTDLYTGREVRGVSSVVERSRAGFVAARLRQMQWYSEGDPDTFPLPSLAELRTGSFTNQCLPDSPASYDIVVRGFVRFVKTITTC